VLYAGYKFSDRILFNSEIEFEHASSGEGAELKGEVGVEFAALDFFIDPMANIRTGLVLMPMGFINQIHEPPFFFGNHRPEVEQRIIPSTWREMGVGLFGQITPSLTYTTYLVNGLNAEGFNQAASKKDVAAEVKPNLKTWVCRQNGLHTFGITWRDDWRFGLCGQFGTKSNVRRQQSQCLYTVI